MAAVFGAIAAAVVPAAASGTAAAAGVTAAAATASTLTTVSTALSIGSALMAVGQGIAANEQAKVQAEFAKTEGEQERAAGAEAARDLAKEYGELVSEQSVVQLANGLDISVGTPANVRKSTQRIADQNISTTRRNAENRASMARLRRRSLLSSGRAALMRGFGSAAQIGADAYQLTG